MAGGDEVEYVVMMRREMDADGEDVRWFPRDGASGCVDLSSVETNGTKSMKNI